MAFILNVVLGLDYSFWGLLEVGLLPFIVGGLIKAGLAALIIPGAWALVRKGRQRRQEMSGCLAARRPIAEASATGRGFRHIPTRLDSTSPALVGKVRMSLTPLESEDLPCAVPVPLPPLPRSPSQLSPLPGAPATAEPTAPTRQRAGPRDGAFPVTIEHAYGETTIEAAARAHRDRRVGEPRGAARARCRARSA